MLFALFTAPALKLVIFRYIIHKHIAATGSPQRTGPDQEHQLLIESYESNTCNLHGKVLHNPSCAWLVRADVCLATRITDA